MRTTPVLKALAATAIAVLGGISVAPSAQAEDWGVDISGTWRVFSDGEWARTNEVKFKQESVLETWTVDVACVSPIECYGEVQSDRGWTGTARLDAFWYVEHVVPNWLPCPNGTFATGYQKFILFGMDPTIERVITRNITTFGGRNITKSDSGACGVNKAKVIELPVRMERLS